MNKKILILFVNPSIGTEHYANQDKLRSYLSLGTLASALRSGVFLRRFMERSGRTDFTDDFDSDNHIFEIHVLNLSLKPEHQAVKGFLADSLEQLHQAPDMVCMTATSAHLDEAAALARAAAEILPGALRIIGGAHVSVAAEDFLKRSEFQVACFGEGVETLSEIALLRWRDPDAGFSTIPGLAFKDGSGRIHLNSMRTPVMALDDYPFASYSLDLFWDKLEDPAENRRHLIYILSGFGCPHDCIFCAQRSIHRKIIRERSAKSIFEEIAYLFARGFRKFAFVQETFLNPSQRLDSFCRLIEEAGMQIEWTAEARADQLQYDQLRRMQAAGLRFIQIGVESGDSDQLKKSGKNIRLEQIVELRNWCWELKINTAFYLLVGLPHQGWQSLLRTALFFKDYPPYNRITRHASVAVAIPYPGTQIWQAQSVRLIDDRNGRMSWPDRSPSIRVNDAGEFIGKNFTETDAMVPEEILEAWLYLDDFCHFLLHGIHAETTDQGSLSLSKSMEYADRLLYMLQRRTIRDLIIRAGPEAAANGRKAAWLEINRLDDDAEKHFKDVTRDTEPVIDIFTRFLAAVRFLNGFETMKRLSIGNRIKWMKLCALIWHLKGREFNDLQFEKDDRKTGLELDRRLRVWDESLLNRSLTQIDADTPSAFRPDDISPDLHASAIGVKFINADNKILKISMD